jgi:hypothetical protein
MEKNEDIKEVNYNDNKDIKLKSKGRPRKKKESTPEPTQTPSEKEVWIQWVKDNRVQFMNSGKKSNEFITNVYKAYNTIYNTNKSRGKCGICDWNIILELKRKFF